MVCFSMHNQTKEVRYEKGQQNSCDLLIVVQEFTEPWQEDGHGYKDYDTALFQAVVRGIDKTRIIDILKTEGIQGVRTSFEPWFSQRKTDRSFEVFDGYKVPIFELEIRVAFSSTDPFFAAADALLDDNKIWNAYENKKSQKDKE